MSFSTPQTNSPIKMTTLRPSQKLEAPKETKKMTRSNLMAMILSRVSNREIDLERKSFEVNLECITFSLYSQYCFGPADWIAGGGQHRKGRGARRERAQ